MNRMIFLILLGFIYFGCAVDDDPLPDPPKPEPDTAIFEMIWATRMDSDKEVIGTDNVFVYKDWYIKGGDYGFPPTLLFFNKVSGEKEFEFIHSGLVNQYIFLADIQDNIMIAICGGGILGIDLETRTSLWEIDLKAMNLQRNSGVIFKDNNVYHPVTEKLYGASGIDHMMQIDIATGQYEYVYTIHPDSTDINKIRYPVMSPPAFWTDPATNQEIMVFNCKWYNGGSPLQTYQDMMAVDVEKGELVWQSRVSETASNGLFPPILYENSIITGGDWSIYSLDMKNGDLNWKYAFDYPWPIWTYTNHLIMEDRLYVNNGQFDVTCLDPETGDLIWNNPEGGPNCTWNMNYYQDMLVFTSLGYGSVMILDAFTGETLHRERKFDNSIYWTDIAYDVESDMFFASSFKHAIGFKIHKPE